MSAQKLNPMIRSCYEYWESDLLYCMMQIKEENVELKLKLKVPLFVGGCWILNRPACLQIR